MFLYWTKDKIFKSFKDHVGYIRNNKSVSGTSSHILSEREIIDNENKGIRLKKNKKVCTHL